MSWIINFLLYLWDLFKLWIHTLFVTPFQNMEMLWILVPIWLGWFLAEFFQEKTGTSMGNAISNSVIVFWGSIDWFRQTVALIGAKTIIGFWNIATRYALAGIVFIYGALIIVLGIKGRKIIQRTGRIREVTYVFAMFTPVFYNIMPFSIEHIVATLLFFPLFYFAIELFDKYTPDPKAIIEDNAAISGQSTSAAKRPALSSNNFSSSSPGLKPMSPRYRPPLKRSPGYGAGNSPVRPPGTSQQRPGNSQQRNPSYAPMRPKF